MERVGKWKVSEINVFMFPLVAVVGAGALHCSLLPDHSRGWSPVFDVT